ncbi:MAG: methyltransferase domain-containing protein [Actinobacteria bacterium]|nr:methyltransferase domain-containing protein [Actinomycetota bacterium]
MPVHEVAQTGFGNEADAYERARPTYPPDAVAWLVDALGIAPGRTVADLAAGTGKLTRLLVPSAARIVALEPLPAMYEVLRRREPNVAVVATTAETIGLRAASLDAITVAQAFHWFDAARALREFHRVLRPGGRVGLVWNARDRSVSWVDALWSVMDRVEKRAPWRDHDEWRESAFVDNEWFGPLHEATFRHEQRLTIDGVVDRFRSVSHVAAMAPAARDKVLDEIRSLLATDPATRGRAEVAIPYRVDCYWAERR